MNEIDRPIYAREAEKLAQALKDQMVAVATGGPRIGDVNHEFRENRTHLRLYLDPLGLPDPIPYEDLWGWYGRWTSGDLPSYRSRREFLTTLFAPLLQTLRDIQAGRKVPEDREPTGWVRVDRGIGKLRENLAAAEDEEDYQSVGLLGREIMISLAQAVYDAERHPSTDGVVSSTSDAKRMLDAYVESELAGSENERVRKHARSAVDLANELTHKRTATFRLAALCAEAVSSACNQIAIVSGQRDPS